MLKAIIIDDEINGAKFLEKLVTKNCQDIEVIGLETDPENGIELIKNNPPDVLFLDIEMPGMTGFEMLEQLKHLSFQVIFTTAYDNYALKAFKYNTVDYLLKPIAADDLIAAVNKLKTKVDTVRDDLSILKLLEKLNYNQTVKRIVINSQNETIYIEPQKIIRLEADNNYTNVILIDGRKILSTKTLKDYENTLSLDVFFRCHKTAIVNINHIDRFVKTEGGYVVMTDHVQVTVSREKRQELLAILADK